MRDQSVARRISVVWEAAARFPDLDYSQKHVVAKEFSEYLVREKSRLDNENPLFKARCREAERLVSAITHAVNVGEQQANAARAALVQRARERRQTAKDIKNGKS